MRPDPADSLVGHTLGHYKLHSLLDDGGTAEVFLAYDQQMVREVAVKVLLPYLATDQWYVARFRMEVRRVAALGHPNIVPLYEFGEQEGLLYLVMPLAPESLRDRLLRLRHLPIADALAVAIQVASALEAAHAQGIVHRDVKPEHILLDRDGHALLSGFGIARDLASLRRLDARQTLATSGLPVGTPEYMPPEQLRGGTIDQRVDVYALGATLYEVLTGVVPHEASTPYEVAALVLTAPITAPSHHNPRVWPELEAAVLKALVPDPSERYSSVADFAMSLRAASKHSVGGVLRATLPIFRKTALVDSYEGPTDQLTVFEEMEPVTRTSLSGAVKAQTTLEGTYRDKRTDSGNSTVHRHRLKNASPTSELTRVFVSHSHADDTFTERLVADLRSAGADVWVDQNNITYDDFIKRINEGLKGREWLVLVMTPNSLRSRWVEREVNAALQMVVDKRMRGVIPIVSAPCQAEAIPPMWATLHRYDATVNYDTALRGLLHALGLSNR